MLITVMLLIDWIVLFLFELLIFADDSFSLDKIDNTQYQ